MVQFMFEFDRPERKYKPGETVNITVRLSLSEGKKCRSIQLKYTGDVKVEWTESHEVQRDGKNHTEHINYKGDQNVLQHTDILVGERGNSEIHIPPGNHVYQSSFVLPRNLPQSFEGDFGHIRYEVKIKMDVSWGFDKKESLPFYIQPHLDLNELPRLKNPVRAHESKTFGFCCWQSEPLHIFNVLPKSGFAVGERAEYSLEIKNDSDVPIDEATITLKEIVTFKVNSPSSKEKQVERTLWTHDFCSPGSVRLVAALQNKFFATEMYFDPSKEFKTFQGAGFITVDYRLKSEARVSGCHTNLENRTYLTVGTIPFYNSPYATPMATISPSAPPVDVQGPVTEQPLPSYNEAVRTPKLPIPQATGSHIGWAVAQEETPPPTFQETMNIGKDGEKKWTKFPAD